MIHSLDSQPMHHRAPSCQASRLGATQGYGHAVDREYRLNTQGIICVNTQAASARQTKVKLVVTNIRIIFNSLGPSHPVQFTGRCQTKMIRLPSTSHECR